MSISYVIKSCAARWERSNGNSATPCAATVTGARIKTNIHWKAEQNFELLLGALTFRQRVVVLVCFVALSLC